MSDFSFYFSWGWHHIISWDAMDHLLFIMVLSAIYLLRNWKQVLVLVTAFTIGHSLTLALSVYDLVHIRQNLVEVLIPCTILATAVFNFLIRDYQPKNLRLNYFLALLFGLVHGLGFAGSIRFALADDQSIGWCLFAFNIGLEAGQVLVVTGILLLSWLIVDKIKLNRKWWVWGLSATGFILAARMVFERL